MTEADGEPVAVPRQVHCELQTVRQIGACDLRSSAVLDVLEAYDFEATRDWIVENPDRYERAVARGTRDETFAQTTTERR